jgi:hypothetical protein
MITESHFRMQMAYIDPMELPGDLIGVADKLDIARDRTGFALFPNILPPVSSSVAPRIYFAEHEPQTLSELFYHSSINTVAMRLDQAAAFVITYATQMRKAPGRAHPVWIPVIEDQNRLGVLRLFFRDNGKFDLFAYAHDDTSRWEGGEKYLVAYHKFGTEHA